MNPLRGWYERSLFPWLHDRFVSLPVLERLRAEGLVAARGRLVEIGFGTGLNLPHYPAAMTSLAAVEINSGMLRRAAPRIKAFPVPVEVVAAAAEQLPFQDGAFDTAVSFLTLCSVADPGRA
ncbi:MAG: methyltransferase domain-containing protein, partial [Deltaproteobacteria bacterium]|nr:methyltransferase domain-containing protein [Deltaproteobacteria bacterium]